MGYKVIHFFTDLQDGRHPYRVGDIFPRNGLSVTDARLKELSSANNRQKKPLIELVNEEIPAEQAEEKQPFTKTEINRMSTAELRQLAKSTGVESANEMTGTELKKYLIDMFGL